jgi:hypothetical protein
MTVLAAYFPDAIEALVGLCIQGNVQHKVDTAAVNPFKLESDAITWDRSKSTDQMNTLMRHAWDHERAKRGGPPPGIYDVDGILHIVKVLWRAAAEAQLTIERQRNLALDVSMFRDQVAKGSAMTATEVNLRCQAAAARAADLPPWGAYGLTGPVEPPEQAVIDSQRKQFILEGGTDL